MERQYFSRISNSFSDSVCNRCAFSVFCRELVTAGGRIPEVYLDKGTADVRFSVDPMHEFGLSAVSLIPKDKWNNDFLQQVYQNVIVIFHFRAVGLICQS